MAFSNDENDAIGEVANIFAGAVACSFSNMTDADISISVPNIREWHNDSDDSQLPENTYGYSFRSTSFSGGYCILEIRGNYERFKKLLGNGSNESGLVGHMVYKVVQTAIEPLELLLGQSLKVDEIKKMGEAWSDGNTLQSGEYLAVNFDILIDEEISGNIMILFPVKIAKMLASRFLMAGIAVATV